MYDEGDMITAPAVDHVGGVVTEARDICKRRSGKKGRSAGLEPPLYLKVRVYI